MADSGSVNILAVEAPRGREADGDVGIVCGSPAHGLTKLGKTKLEEYGKVVKRSLKRRRVSAGMIVNPTEKENLINALEKETCELFKYFNEVLVWKLGSVDEKCASVSSAIACMVEGSKLPFSRLANEIYDKLRACETVTLASVRRDVHFISSRISYGMDSGNTDFFEDESESSLWCWEVRDLKLIPRNKCKLSKDIRKGREKVRERIAALSETSSVLKTQENQANCITQFLKASEKLNKTLSLEEICLLVPKLTSKSENEICKMESTSKEKELLKELETNKGNTEKEMKKHDHDLQKEKPQNERELKLRQIKTEKEERRREKEEAEAKKQLSIQKQASFMERFLKSKHSNYLDNQVDQCPKHVMPSDSFGMNFSMLGSATGEMDSALSQQDCFNIKDLQKSHVAAWHKMRHSNKSQHWGIRHKPKTKTINEPKLLGSSCGREATRTIKAPNSGNACSEINASEKADFTMMMDDIEERSRSNHNGNCIASHGVLLPRRGMKLLQFDKSYRPAYYGSWSKKSVVIGPRRPFAKDKDLDYDFNSDEEWEEEEPGESLSDCDKDDEEEILDEDSKADDEAESDDSFLVPDGYLSEDEGVQDDIMRADCTSNEARISPGCMQEMNNDEFIALLKHLSYLDNLTQQSLRRDQSRIITNFLHEKSNRVAGKDLTGMAMIEEICLHVLCMVPYPGGPAIEEPCANHSDDPDVCYTKCKNSGPPGAVAAISDSLLPEYVKKEVLDKLGSPASPEPSSPADKGCRPKGIDTFFAPKRCLSLSNSSPWTHPKPDPSAGEDSNHGIQENSP